MIPMIDVILRLPAAAELPAHLNDENGNPALSAPQAHNPAIDRLHYVRLHSDQLDEWRPYATVLAEAPYTGTGTAERLYQQIKDDPEKLALYESVYDTSPREVDDGEGGTITYTPPFKFGMLAESYIPVPETITARQARIALAKRGLLSRVDRAIGNIEDPEARQIAGIEWEYASTMDRDSQWVHDLHESLGMNAEEVDNFFREAAQI